MSLPMFHFEKTNILLLTWTPVEKNLKARVYRAAHANKWVVMVRDSAYDGIKPKYVSQQDFELLCEAQQWAKAQTGKEAKVSL